MPRSPQDKGPLHIALAFPLAQAHLQSLTQGITHYVKEHVDWVLTTGGEFGGLSIEQLKGWHGDGIIAALIQPSEARAARRFMKAGIPVVTIAGALRKPGVPRVSVANSEIGKLAAEHLLACGFRRFAFYGVQGVAYSRDRHAGFAARLRDAGGECQVHLSPGTHGRRLWQDDVGDLRQWLGSLDPPVGIFAVNDFRARLLIDACGLAGIAIPEQAGVVGVDNNPMQCEFSHPGLTSIDCDWYRVGFQAAHTLHQILCGETPEAECRIPPREVVRRTSTAVTLAQDPRLARAIMYIADHVGEVFGVERLLAVSDVSRRKLEQLFRAEMKMSPYQYLCQRRIERARVLLEGRPAPKLRQISRLCGFRDPRRFRIVFQRTQGQSPAQYRRASQQKMLLG